MLHYVRLDGHWYDNNVLTINLGMLKRKINSNQNFKLNAELIIGDSLLMAQVVKISLLL